jgi:hypothetical protein
VYDICGTVESGYRHIEGRCGHTGENQLHQLNFLEQTLNRITSTELVVKEHSIGEWVHGFNWLTT